MQSPAVLLIEGVDVCSFSQQEVHHLQESRGGVMFAAGAVRRSLDEDDPHDPVIQSSQGASPHPVLYQTVSEDWTF